MSSVDEKMAAYDAHPFADGVRRFREELLRRDPAIAETWKWNAPNFTYHGEDRVTFRLQPRDMCQLVLHRGVAVTDAPSGFSDPTGWIEWKSPDRGVLTFAELAQLDERMSTAVDLCVAWMRA